MNEYVVEYAINKSEERYYEKITAPSKTWALVQFEVKHPRNHEATDIKELTPVEA